MPSSRTLLSLCLSSISLGVLAGCPSDGPAVGPKAHPHGITASNGSDITLTFGALSSLAGNDCPDPDAPAGVVSLSIEGTLVGDTGRITFCIPRPDLLADGRALGTTSTWRDAVVDFRGAANGCTFARDTAKPPTGTGTGTGVCKNGTDAAGFALEVAGTVHVKRTCGATVNYARSPSPAVASRRATDDAGRGRIRLADRGQRAESGRPPLVDRPGIEIVGPRGVAHGHETLLAWLDRAQLELTTRRSFARGDVVVLAQHGVWAQSEADVATSFVIRDGKVVRLARYDTIAEALADAGLTVDDELARTWRSGFSGRSDRGCRAPIARSTSDSPTTPETAGANV